MAISRPASMVVLIALASCGCMAMARPRAGWVPDREAAGLQVRGGLATLQLRAPIAGSTTLTGELLAADADSFLVLQAYGVVAVSRAMVERGTVDATDANGSIQRRLMPRWRSGEPPAEDLARFPGVTTVRAREWLLATPAAAAGDSATPR